MIGRNCKSTVKFKIALNFENSAGEFESKVAFEARAYASYNEARLEPVRIPNSRAQSRDSILQHGQNTRTQGRAKIDVVGIFLSSASEEKIQNGTR